MQHANTYPTSGFKFSGVSPLHVAPPGPPQKFTAQVLSDTEIILTWKVLELTAPAVYEICYNALLPVCVDRPVSVILEALSVAICNIKLISDVQYISYSYS